MRRSGLLAFQPFSEAKPPATREQLIERLIDRDLILQQMKLQPEPPITDAEVDAELTCAAQGDSGVRGVPLRDGCGLGEVLSPDQGFTLEELQRALEAAHGGAALYRAALPHGDPHLAGGDRRLLPEDAAAGV